MADELTKIFRAEHGRMMAAALRRNGGDFDRAEESVQHAFAKAVETWAERGVPQNPQAWLMRVAANRAIDDARRVARVHNKADDVADYLVHSGEDNENEFGDDRLRLIFTCCHPSLSLEAQVALTLRTVCGVETEAIASAFLVATSTMAQRLVRAKNKIRAAGIPYKVPDGEGLGDRIAAVAAVIYLVFNAGYSRAAKVAEASADADADLCREAQWLARLAVSLLPENRELRGLLALILLHGARSPARFDGAGDLVLLADQDRNRWDRRAIEEGCELVVSALRGGAPGPYALQAAIAAVHAEAISADETDWAQIVGLYNLLFPISPTPIVELNRAVAIAMDSGPAAGLRILDSLGERGDLETYPYLPAARADLLRRMGRIDEAISAYRRALESTTNEPERRFLRMRLTTLADSD